MTTKPTEAASQSLIVWASGAGLLASVASLLNRAVESGYVPDKYLPFLLAATSGIALLRRLTDKNPKPIQGIIPPR
jgi:hypothetical protein